MIVHCLYDKMLPINSFKTHPKNPNNHPKDQIEALARIIKYQGIREPIEISKLSGFIVAGHGRLLAAKQLGLKEFPAVYQDFKDKDQELARLISDNAIAKQSELNYQFINAEIIPELGPDCEGIENLGLVNFEIEPADKYIEEKLPKEPKSCPNCGHKL